MRWLDDWSQNEESLGSLREWLVIERGPMDWRRIGRLEKRGEKLGESLERLDDLNVT
jgi:hypothetical protein